MLEAKYFKDYRHNYMILQCGQEAVSRSYQYKILTSDKIKEILRCSVRHINGITYYYYDISSRTTLKNLYQSTKMSCEQVRELLWQLHGICDKLAGFFMEEAGLVLLPEHIYFDFSSQKYIGLYYPDYQVSGADAYEPLMNFLLEHIDTEDRQLTEKMYRIYELAGEAHFLIEDALQILEEGKEVEQEIAPDKSENFNVMDDLPSAEPLKEEKPESGRSFFYPVSAVLSVLGMAGAAIVYHMYDLVREEEIALCGIIAVLGVCFLLGMWGTLRASRKKQSAKTKSAQEERIMPDRTSDGIADGYYTQIADRADEMSYKLPGGKLRGTTENESDRRRYGGTGGEAAADNIVLENVISRDMNLEAMPQRTAAAATESPRAAASSQNQGTDYYGNTVFFDGSRAAEYKLYAVDRRNKQHIELKQFPCTVGKMAGCVDHVLADNSVSRIHARFDRQGDRVLLTDMNSTNGTYKNGLRMQPQETVEIEPGDEIRFGSLNYCYR